eukprot:1185847-Prorocentrum_minimum.AAC.2
MSVSSPSVDPLRECVVRPEDASEISRRRACVRHVGECYVRLLRKTLVVYSAAEPKAPRMLDMWGNVIYDSYARRLLSIPQGSPRRRAC